jgi:hypothetical protein
MELVVRILEVPLAIIQDSGHAALRRDTVAVAKITAGQATATLGHVMKTTAVSPWTEAAGPISLGTRLAPERNLGAAVRLRATVAPLPNIADVGIVTQALV